MQSLRNGTQLGAYTLVRLIGRGGMGEVYEAHENKLQRRVALKIIAPSNPEEHNRDDLIRRFMQEARTLAQVNHPNVVTIYSIDRVGDVQFIAMEYVDGTALRDILKKSKFKSSEAAPLFEQMLEGLRCLHDNRIIHRDLKPHNIMIRPNGQIKILDFGIAKQIGAAGTDRTSAGVIVGTIPYMAPEVRTGAKATPRSDFWSLGAIFYECVVGKPLALVMRDHPDAKAIVFEPQAGAEIPDAMRDFITKMCANRPSDRFGSASEAIDALNRAQLGESPFTPRELDDAANEETVIATLSEIRRARSRSENVVKERPYLIGGAAILSIVIGSWLGLKKESPTLAPSPIVERPEEAPPVAQTHPLPSATPTPAPTPTTTTALTLTDPQDRQILWLEPTRIPTLSWSRVLKPEEYEIQVAHDSAFKKIVVNEPVSGTSFRPERILAEGVYFWRLVPQQPSLPAAGPYQFSLAHLNPIELIQPDAQHVFELPRGRQDLPVEVSWTCKAGQPNYRVQLSTRDDFNEIMQEQIISACHWRSVPLPPGVFYWRVRIDGVKETENMWSDSRPFAIKAPSVSTRVSGQPSSQSFEIAAPVLTNPQQKITLSFSGRPRDLASLSRSLNSVPTLKWRPVRGARSYLVQISSSRNFSHLLSEESVTTSQLQWRSVRPGKFYWRVRAISSQRTQSNFSGRGTLNVMLPAPQLNPVYKFDLNPRDSKERVTVDWSPSPLADRYIVQLGTSRKLANADERSVTQPRLSFLGQPGVSYIRVAAADSSGEPISPFSKAVKIEMNQTFSLGKPFDLKPASGAKAIARGGKISVVFSWGRVRAANAYTVEVSNSPSFSNVLERRKSAHPGAVLKQAELTGRIYWRVRAEGVEGVSDWSDYSFFDVSNAP